jgi:hypothetical protein
VRDHVATTDQSRARIEHTRNMMVGSWIQLSFAKARTEQQAAIVERSIERLARSRIKLSATRRTLGRR